MGKMIEDVSLAIDALSDTDIIDAERIALFGFTLGGTVGLYSAAMDERVKCVVSIAGFTPMRTDVAETGMSGMTRYSHLHGLIPNLGFYKDKEEYLPYDYEDLISLVAPRNVLVVQPRMDRDADYEQVSEAVARAKKIFELYGAGQNLDIRLPNDYGRLTNEMQSEAIEWLNEHINSN
ncbi:MAG: prolyl oligopeptidase family serine peptidase [Rikenellaceae bacterium]|nr:prolyl oligopeptidase family serine peptidase [Rikenellaceae bacterium]